MNCSATWLTISGELGGVPPLYSIDGFRGLKLSSSASDVKGRGEVRLSNLNIATSLARLMAGFLDWLLMW